MLCLCLYAAFARTLPLVKGGKGVYRFSKYRPWALAGIGLISILIGATIFIGTATPTLKIGHVSWIGSRTRCQNVLNGETIEAQEAYARSTSSNKPLSSFNQDTDAAISFDVSSHQKVKINKIYVEVLSYQPLSTVESCIHPTLEATNLPTIGPPYTIYPGQILPIEYAKRFAAPINPDKKGRRFPAYLETKSDEIGFVRLDPGVSESLAVFFATQTPGLYSISCCNIEFELSPGKEPEIEQADWKDQVLLLLFYKAPRQS